ncbi:MAG: glycine cleavage system protein H [Bacteroidota bacterium]|jgi:glycine cleavage system H protein
MTVLFVVGTIVFFFVIDFAVRKLRGESLLPAVRPAQIPHYPVRIPEGIFFAKSHTWISLFPSGKIRLGVDDFVGRLLKTPEVIFLRKPGDSVKKGDPLMQLKSAKHVLTISSPLDGDVLEANEELADHSELLQQSLFDNGWGYVIKPKRSTEVKEMLLGNEARTWIRNEFRRLRELLIALATPGTVEPAFLQDGGLPTVGVLDNMDDEAWQTVEHEFLEIQ